MSDNLAHVVHITTVAQSLAFVQHQVPVLKTAGFRVSAISSPSDLLADFGRRFDIATYGVEMPRSISPTTDVRAVIRLARLLSSLRPDIVHAHTPKGGLLGMVAATVAQVPFRLYQMRGFVGATATGSKRILLRQAERTSCSLAHKVLIQSPSLHALALEERLCSPRKASVLLRGSNGIDTSAFHPYISRLSRERVRAEFGIESHAPVVGFVGRLVRDKGIHELAEAWRSVSEAFPQARLLLVGPFENRDPVAATTRRELESTSSVVIAGHRSDLPALYSAMDVVVLPTYREGFPNVLLEAAGLGLPVVATDVVGCVDAVVDGVTGTLIPPRDATALARAIVHYLSNEEVAQRHGANARRNVVEHFDASAMAQAVLSTYLAALRRR